MIGSIGLHVDDFLHTGEEDLKASVSRKLAEIFKWAKQKRRSLSMWILT